MLRKNEIPFVVAPYEADSQLAFLFHAKKIDFVITEDSDLLAHGVTAVLYKLDLHAGMGR